MKGMQLISMMGCVASIHDIAHEDLITAAEEVSGHFHKLSMRKPLLAALEAPMQ